MAELLIELVKMPWHILKQFHFELYGVQVDFLTIAVFFSLVGLFLTAFLQLPKDHTND